MVQVLIKQLCNYSSSRFDIKSALLSRFFRRITARIANEIGELPMTPMLRLTTERLSMSSQWEVTRQDFNDLN